jgi:hypothetical protein
VKHSASLEERMAARLSDIPEEAEGLPEGSKERERLCEGRERAMPLSTSKSGSHRPVCNHLSNHGLEPDIVDNVGVIIAPISATIDD